MRNAGRAVLIAVYSLGLVCCSHAGPAPTAQQSQAPAKPHRPVAAPATPAATQPPPGTPAPPKPAPPASVSPSPAAKRPSVPLPAAPKHIERLPADAKPQILDVVVSETSVQPGDHVVGRVVTTSNVASVEARIGGYAVTLAKVAVGRFEMAYTVGSLPWFVHGNFTMQVIARNTRGDAVTRAVPLTVR